MGTYLVFERVESTDSEPGSYQVRESGRVVESSRPVPPVLLAYRCLGGVQATTPEDAARAVVGVTRRVSKLAIIEAEFIDFTASLQDPESTSVALNP